LHCADETLYAGITNDLERRVAAHNKGTAAKYTRGRLPVRLVYVEKCTGRSAAQKREIKIKRLSREEKMKLLDPGLSKSDFF